MSITNSEHLALAISEAKRFIAAAEKVQNAKGHQRGIQFHHWYVSPKDTGACRRASMDLTRALADLRRSS